MKKLWLFLSLLICSTLIAGCNKQANFSPEVSKESVAILLENDENLISPIAYDEFQTAENVLSVLSEDQIDIALQIISENLAKDAIKEDNIPEWTYQDYYERALTQFRSIRNVSLELFKKDLNELSVDEYLDIIDNHLSELYENAISIAPSEKIKNVVWGWDDEQQVHEIIDEPEVLDEEWTIDIPLDWLVYRNDEYWFQVKFWKERGGGEIYESYIVYNKVNNDNFNDWGWVKNPMILFTVSSPWRPTFELIADIIVYTYDEYEQARQNQMDPECLMCSLEEFDNAIIWKNNKYYFLLWRSNRSDDELKTMFPSLECREETDSSVYWTYTYIYCDWIEYINWEPKKTWKNWIEQILPAESFSFFDV